ncbi:hypothetical protein T02_10911 [Trichinella nativa]|uniref:Uncharacterized protein n=1 Tax=Trichinella nativa TaxID=6335 RepID=A0A0V1LGI3_9BILA|nr:hypothetical protein T02_10911 [Trichinella nativa]
MDWPKLRRVFVSAALCPGVHQNFGFFSQNIPGRQQESTGVYVVMTSAASMLSGCSKIPCCMKETTPHASTGSMANKTLQSVKEAFLLSEFRPQRFSVRYDSIVAGFLGAWDLKNNAMLQWIGAVCQRYMWLMKDAEMLEHSTESTENTSACETFSPSLAHICDRFARRRHTHPVMISVRSSAILQALGHQVGNAWNGGTRHPSGRPRSMVSCSDNCPLTLRDPPSLEQRRYRPMSSLHRDGWEILGPVNPFEKR